MQETMQRSVAWYEQRVGKLTASNLGAVLGLNKLSRKQAMQRALGKDTFTGNEATQWGQDNEMNGIVDYSVLTENVVEATGLHVHPMYSWLAGSPDGLVGDVGMIEVKCPFYRKNKLHDTIPLHYYVQMNALLEITGRQWCDYICWSPCGMRVYRVHRDSYLFQYLLTIYGQFYSAMCNEAPPPPIRDEHELHESIATSMLEHIDYNYYDATRKRARPSPSSSDAENDA